MNSLDNNSEHLPLASTPTYVAGITQGAAFRLLKRYTDACLAEYDITTTQWFIIGLVGSAENQGMRVTELATTLDTTLPFLTKSVNQLEAKGYLVRRDDQEDSRSKRVYLADDIDKKVTQIETMLRRKMHETFYSTIDRDDLQAYVRVLHQISLLDV